MELFTLGIGHYTEPDVKEAARALTGWTVAEANSATDPPSHDDGEKDDPRPDRQLDRRRPRRHPPGAPGDGAIASPGGSANEFFGEGVVSDAAIDELADGLRQAQSRHRLGASRRSSARSSFSRRRTSARASPTRRVRHRPAASLGMLATRRPARSSWPSGSAGMGQDLFYPPNVGGWPGGRAWLSTRTIIARANCLAALVAGNLSSPARPPDFAALASQYTSAKNESEIVTFPLPTAPRQRTPTTSTPLHSTYLPPPKPICTDSLCFLRYASVHPPFQDDSHVNPPPIPPAIGPRLPRPARPGVPVPLGRQPPTPKHDDRILVVIQLDGGNDGLNTVIPYADENYARFRRELRIKTDDILKLDDAVGLHPSMKAAAELFDDSRLAIVQGVGYPNPNRSHFESMAIWHHARLDADEHDGNGWLGRAAESMQPRNTSTADSIYIGADAVPVALRGRRANALSLQNESDLQLNAP